MCERYACYAMTRNIYDRVVPSLKSLLYNNPGVRVFLLIEDDDVGFELPANVTCLNVSGQTYFYKHGPNTNCRWTYMVMMKTVLCHLFPDLDRILWLDCDTIVDGDISELWDIYLGDNYFAACEEIHRTFPTAHYFNAGVMMINLVKMRDGKADEAVDLLNRVPFPYVEQDCLNILCNGRILELPSKYNVNRFTKPTKEEVIIHYAATRDWYEAAPKVLHYKFMEWSWINGSF